MMSFLKDALSEVDGTPSSKRLMYFLAIVCGLGISWYLLLKFGVIDQLFKLLDSIIYSTSAAYGVGRGLENSSALNNFGGPGIPQPKISELVAKKLIDATGLSDPDPGAGTGIVPKGD